jgi:hypothetical protein
MNEKAQDFFKLLFNANENICVQDSQFATHSVPLEDILSGNQVKLIATDPKYNRDVNSDNLILAALNPINGSRLDSNVTNYRSFLIELDVGTLKEQLNTIKHLKMPFTAQVFSGNKSIHTVITLDEDLKTEAQYRLLARWIFAIVTTADDKCENPSRCVRIPEVYREPGKKQRLVELRQRVSHKEFFAWLNKWPHLAPKPKEKRVIPEGEGDYDRLSTWAKYQIKKGIEFKNGRNQTWFALAYDFALAGYSEDQTIDELGKYYEEERDFKEREWLGAIASAFKSIDKK